MKRILIIILLLAVSVNMLKAQGGSNYSIFGLGDINSAVTSGYEGMGGTSVAMPLASTINLTNPAMISQLTTTRLLTGYRFNQHFVASEKSNLFQNNGSINGLVIAFVFDSSKKIAASLGLVPSTKVSFSVSKNFETQYLDQTIKGTSSYTGSGGLSNFFLNFGSKVIEGLHIGSTIFGNFGSIIYINSVTYPASYTFSTYYDQEDYFSGLGYKFGAFYEVNQSLSIGAYYGDYGKLSVERYKRYSSELSSDTSFIENFDINPPKSFGFGISYKTGKFLLGADYKQLIINDLNYSNSTFNKFRNGTEISFGGVRYGNPNRRADYLDRIDYRLGLTYNSLYYEVAGQNINEIKLSMGAGMPFAESGLLDVAFIIGQRGTTSNGLVNEYFGRLVIDFSLGETWFKPFKREY